MENFSVKVNFLLDAWILEIKISMNLFLSIELEWNVYARNLYAQKSARAKYK